MHCTRGSPNDRESPPLLFLKNLHSCAKMQACDFRYYSVIMSMQYHAVKSSICSLRTDSVCSSDICVCTDYSDIGRLPALQGRSQGQGRRTAFGDCTNAVNARLPRPSLRQLQSIPSLKTFGRLLHQVKRGMPNSYSWAGIKSGRCVPYTNSIKALEVSEASWSPHSQRRPHVTECILVKGKP